MPFRPADALMYKHRVSLPDGRSVICSCGTTSKSVAKAVAGFVRQLNAARDLRALEAIVEKRVTSGDAYDAHGRQGLPQLLASANDADLSPLVAEWNGGGNPKYLAQVRRLVPSGARFLPRTVLHQRRHSFAVMHLKRGCDHQWLKGQLGHAPQSTLIYSVYGTYFGAQKLTAAQRDQMPESQKSATTGATRRKVASR